MKPEITLLPSGLAVISDTMPDAASASLGLWVGVGTRHEQPEESGLSHLLEHMFFKGSTNRDVRTLNRTIENVGGSLNAYTTREQTAYTARVLGEDVPLAMDLVSDMLLNPLFDAADLEREKGVIASEIGEAYDDPDDWVFDQFQLTAYPDQPLGKPVLGSVETLAGINRTHLHNYVGRHYRAGRCALVASGAVDHARIVELALKHFTLDAGQPMTPEPAHYKGGTAVEHRDIDQVHLCFGWQGVTYGHKLFQAQNLLAMALGGGASSRLYHEVREERGLAYSISAYMAPFLDDGLVMIDLATDPSRAREAIKVTLDQMACISSTLTQEELDRARALARAGLLMGLESTENRAERLAGQWLQFGRLIQVNETLENLHAVTLEDIRAIGELLATSPLTRSAVGPTEGLDWT